MTDVNQETLERVMDGVGHIVAAMLSEMKMEDQYFIADELENGQATVVIRFHPAMASMTATLETSKGAVSLFSAGPCPVYNEH